MSTKHTNNDNVDVTPSSGTGAIVLCEAIDRSRLETLTALKNGQGVDAWIKLAKTFWRQCSKKTGDSRVLWHTCHFVRKLYNNGSIELPFGRLYSKQLVVELICKLLAQDGPSCGEMWSSTCNPGADFHTRFTNATKRDRRLLLHVDEAELSEEKLHNMFKAMMDQHEMACKPKVNASTWPTTCAGSSLPKTTPTLCLCRALTGSSLSSAPQTGKKVPG